MPSSENVIVSIYALTQNRVTARVEAAKQLLQNRRSRSELSTAQRISSLASLLGHYRVKQHQI
jgi:hypothetical protein